MSATKEKQSEKAFSINGDDFPYLDPADALQALADDGRLVEGTVYYEVDIEEMPLSYYLRPSLILDYANDAIYDDIGEAAEGAFDASKQAEEELRSLIADWCTKHLGGGNYWRCVGPTRQLTVTADDVADHGGDA